MIPTYRVYQLYDNEEFSTTVPTASFPYIAPHMKKPPANKKYMLHVEYTRTLTPIMLFPRNKHLQTWN